MLRRTFLQLSMAGTGARLVRAEEGPEPVYVLLHSRFTDHINPRYSFDTFRHWLPRVERLRRERGAEGVSWLMEFTGAMSEVFADFNRGNRFVDETVKAVSAGYVEAGYNGYDEPAPLWRPKPNLRGARTAEERWRARLEAAEWFLTEYKHGLTGEPDADRSGGLKRTGEVFGRVASVTGYSLELIDTEFAHLLRRSHPEAVLQGLWEADTIPGRNLNGYRGSLAGVGELMSPGAKTASEVYWMGGFPRLSRASGVGVRGVAAAEGVKGLQAVLAAANRRRPHVIHLELGNYRMFLRPEALPTYPVNPVQYGYQNPKAPDIPEVAYRERAGVEAARKEEEAAVRWLVEEFFPANPGSRFVSCGELRRAVEAERVRAVSRVELGRFAESLLAAWGGNTNPPAYVSDGGRYLSLAEMYGALARGLAAPGEERLAVGDVYGPLELHDGVGPNVGTVTRTAVRARAVAEAERFAGTGWERLPRNVIPGWVEVGGERVNAAQFLRLMAETLVGREEELPLRLRDMASAASLHYPTARPGVDLGITWTLKPAVLGW